jgi:maltooligosyltrehalose trehalohydrolase
MKEAGDLTADGPERAGAKAPRFATQSGKFGQFGATLLSPNATRFRFWAPALDRITLEVEGFDPIPMASMSGGWFEAEAKCGAGSAYKFRIADNLSVPDPASRALRGDAFGHSLVVDRQSYRWRNLHWRGRSWTETVLYELHVGVYGGFRGVKAILPRLAEIGITAIELMPISAFSGSFNWGYDGVCPYAPSSAYGTPDELKEMIDEAHGVGLMVFLDVVYNHFGPEANFTDAYAPHFFRDDVETPWGRAIDFRRREVRRFYTENALYWLEEFRFDGLRFDAVHAIAHPDWLDETAAEVRARLEPHRRVHLVVENDDNVASHMRDGFFNAQWNDDAHHALHVLLTGEVSGYYAAYAESPAAILARCLAEGFAYQGEPSLNRGGRPRGSPSADLPPSAFVTFLQNHDQIGNRALGERLTTLTDRDALEAAIALQLLCPQIPLIFMGEEVASKNPFLYFAEHGQALAKLVREGRKKEFKHVVRAGGELPDPNLRATFEQSIPSPDPALSTARQSLYRRLLSIRKRHIMPRLEGARALKSEAIGPGAVIASWEFADESILTIVSNLGKALASAASLAGELLFESSVGARDDLIGGVLRGSTTLAVLDTATNVRGR